MWISNEIITDFYIFTIKLILIQLYVFFNYVLAACSSNLLILYVQLWFKLTSKTAFTSWKDRLRYFLPLGLIQTNQNQLDSIHWFPQRPVWVLIENTVETISYWISTFIGDYDLLESTAQSPLGKKQNHGIFLFSF